MSTDTTSENEKSRRTHPTRRAPANQPTVAQEQRLLEAIAGVSSSLHVEIQTVQAQVQRAVAEPHPLCIQGFAQKNSEMQGVGSTLAQQARELQTLGERVTRNEEQMTHLSQVIPPIGAITQRIEVLEGCM